MTWFGLLSLLASLTPAAATAAENRFVGPGRFCGYSPIIDLVEGEMITPTHGGIHGGGFVWQGAFGKLDVYGIGWASKPKGTKAKTKTANGHYRFEQRREGDKFVVAIWNGVSGAAYFRSPDHLTREQFAAIDRVDLFNEGTTPEGCKYRTVFSWD